MQARNRWSLGLAALGLFLSSLSWGQGLDTHITVDGSLPNTSAHDIEGPDGRYLIGESDGYRPGNGLTLYQSLGDLQLAIGDTAVFGADHPTDDIITRVTGGTRSQVYGTLGTDVPSGAGNLWLLNPEGILFGSDAQLNVQGSFYASTADYLAFEENGSEVRFYSALDESGSALSFAHPSAFGFLDAEGPKNGLAGIVVDESKLEVKPLESLMFVGEGIEIRGGPSGFINAPWGFIDLVSVASAGVVELGEHDGRPVLRDFGGLGELTLYDQAYLVGYFNEAYYDPLSIHLIGGQVTVKESSLLKGMNVSVDGHNVTINSSDIFSSAGVNIKAEEDLIIEGRSQIGTENVDTGLGGDVVLSAGNSIVIKGAGTWVGTETTGVGDGGNVVIGPGEFEEMPNVTIADGAVVETGSSGSSAFVSEGEPDLWIFERDGGGSGPATLLMTVSEAENLDQDSLMSSTDAEGAAESSRFYTNLFAALGENWNEQSHTLVLSPQLQVLIEYYVETLQYSWFEAAGAVIGTYENQGNLALIAAADYAAATLKLGEGDGSVPFAGVAAVYGLSPGSEAPTNSLMGISDAGASGDIRITANEFSLLGNAVLETNAFAGQQGAMGDVVIEADTVEVRGDLTSIDTESVTSAAPGSVKIDAREVVFSGGASVSTGTSGEQGAGDITVVIGESLVIEDEAFLSAGSYEIDPDVYGLAAGVVRSGDGGSIRIGPKPGEDGAGISEIEIDIAGGLIDASSLGAGGAGAIDLSGGHGKLTLDGTFVIDAEHPLAELFGLADDEIFALGAGLGTGTKEAGQGGTITIREFAEIQMLNGAGVATTTIGSGDAGDIFIHDVNLLSVRDGAAIESRSFGSGDGGEIRIAADFIDVMGVVELPLEGTVEESLRGGTARAEISTASTSTGTAGNIVLEVTDTLSLQSASVTTSAENSDGGNIFINASGFTSNAAGQLSVDKEPGTPKGQLVHLVDSEITATVGGGQGDGGNVVIDPLAIVLDNSYITASAVGGSGGNILLVADAVISNVPLSQALDASSQAGVDGRVEIQSPETNIERSLKPLAVPFLDASSLLLASCDARGESSGSFQVVSREGGGPAPDELLYVALPGAPMPETSSEIASLYAEAVSQQGTGQWEQSLAPLEQAFTRAEAEGDASQAATLRGGLAAAALALGAYEGAETQLEAAQVEAKSADDQSLQAVLRVRQADLAAVRGRWHEALAGYRDAVQLSQRAEEAGLEAQVQASAARAALEVGDAAATEEALSASRAGISNVKEAAAQNALRLHLGVTASRLAAASAAQSAQRKQALLAAHALLTEAEAKARASQDHRARSFALGELGILYAQERRVSEALSLARRALSAAQAADESGKAGSSADARMRWHGLEGRLLWQQGQAQEAVEAYSRAVALAEASHQDTRLRYGAGSTWFQDEVARLYRELVDVLLQAEGPQWPKAQRQALLAAARQTMEGLKVAELRDYFRDECVVQLEASARGVEDVDPRAAVVYPVVLEDRLELLVSRSDGTKRYTVPVSREKFNAEVTRFGSLLKRSTTRQYLGPAQQLYAWLVAPYQGELAKHGIDTLVFVPGGVLRTVPLAALHDGQGFLIEHYAVAVTPSLDLLAPESLVPGDEDLLLAGLSEPVQGFAALSGVPGELDAIESMYGGEVLLNQAFTEEEFELKLEEERPGIVHLASHAEFTGDPETSFVLTFDGRLSMDELSQLLRSGRYGEQPVELLMLSACETAAGNERAALGLAGVAVRSGARSAMGSLWPVSDEATADLVVDFYRSMGETGVSKARALQTAQNRLRKQPQFGHPFYWAPFLLINNWL